MQLLGGESGIAIDTALGIGDGRLLVSAPVIVNRDIYTPAEPKVDVVDDHHLVLTYPNHAEVKVVLAGSKAVISFSGMPPEATALSVRMVIHRDASQGGRYVLDQKEEVFPEEDERKELFSGTASAFTLIDPAGARLVVQAPDLRLRLENKGAEGWSHFAVSWTFVFADHPNQNSFDLNVRIPEEVR